MIASLRGRVTRAEEDFVVLEVLGVGYQVFVHARTQAQLLPGPAEVELQVHTVVREDSIALYGFLGVEELGCFRQLLTVERIGPKAALAILARAEWPALVDAIARGDHSLLASVPGIGPKTAQRIVLELKGRVEGLGTPTAAPVPGGAVEERAVAALVGLGFLAADAKRAVAEAGGDAGAGAGGTIEELVRAALRGLDRSRTGVLE